MQAETFADRLYAAAARHPRSGAVVQGEVRLDYAQLLDRAGRVAAGLSERGVQPGDRVLTQLPNWWETIVVSWAVFLAGGVLVPIVPIYRERELRYVIDQVDPSVVIAPATYRGHDHATVLRTILADLGSTARLISVRGPSTPDDLAELLRGAAAQSRPRTGDPDDIAVVLYTSGTTANPKGALHSHRTLLAEVRDVAAHCRLDPESTRVFMGSPLSHITGLSYGMLLPADLGCASVLQERWDPAAAVDLIEAEACTFTVSATPFLSGLADTYAARGQTSTLDTFVCGGADIPSELVYRAHQIMGTTVLRTYGSTELPTSTMADPTGDPAQEAMDEGLPMGANEIAVRPSGELVVRGPELFLGYLDPALNETAFDEDGFFRTGDIAAIDSAGRLRIIGRIKDIINRGGEKFSVAEIEAVLAQLAGVRDVAVVAVPDPRLTERACACIVADGTAPTVSQLREAIVAAGLAVQKSPEYRIVVDELPRTASGKIQRFLLRGQAAATLGIGNGRSVSSADPASHPERNRP
jgi:cyclohexanecarboxylate-CoA ligase